MIDEPDDPRILELIEIMRNLTESGIEELSKGKAFKNFDGPSVMEMQMPSQKVLVTAYAILMSGITGHLLRRGTSPQAIMNAYTLAVETHFKEKKKK